MMSFKKVSNFKFGSKMKWTFIQTIETNGSS